MGEPATVSLPSVFDDMEIGVTLHEPETGDILDVNERLSELYGYTMSELREMHVGQYSAPDSPYTHEVAKDRIRAAADGDEQAFEWRVERASGELLWVRVRLVATTIEDRNCVLGEIRDITEYKSRERRLRLLHRVIRHNLRNDTNVLVGYADRLKAAVESETLEDEVETIIEIARDIGNMSDSVRQIEEIADPSVAARSPTDVGDLATDLVADVRDHYPGAELTVDVRDECWVNADVGLEYALGHAIENAVQHSDANHPSVTVSVGEGSASGRVFVAIADDGPTIPDIEIEALDADTTTTSTSHGAGVGLWVMQWCVDSLGGELSFEANEPRGNVVRFSLPATEPPAEASD